MLSLGGQALTRVSLHVPFTGPWYADCDFADDAVGVKDGASVQLVLGATTLVGTLQRSKDGVFALQRKVRVLAGAGGWGNIIPSKAYPNDRGVSPKTVAQDAAAACGETLGSFDVAGRLGNNYARQAGLASRTLDDVAGDVSWWVGYDGTTVVGVRPSHTVVAGVQVLEVDPRHATATLGVDEITDVAIGDTITDERLGKSLVVRSLEVHADDTKLRVIAWCGTGKRNLLLDAITNIVNKILEARGLFGTYRYRVTGMRGTRVDVSPVNVKLGLPAQISISMSPGVAGAHATLKSGSVVLISFVDGNRGDPRITSFGGREDPNNVPDRLELGGPNGADVARKGDTVTGLLPPAVFVGTIVVGGVPSPATGAIVWNPPQIIATISDGSSKVGVAT